jgi:hypothetical protein
VDAHPESRLKGTTTSIAALWHRDIAMSGGEPRERWSSVGTRAPSLGSDQHSAMSDEPTGGRRLLGRCEKRS